jgi:HK97 family phage prohead protease
VPGERLFRATPVDLELRGDGRTVVGIAMPFDQPTEIREERAAFTEVFRAGSFRKTIAERGPRGVKVFGKHQRAALPVGRASLLREDTAGLYSELRVSATSAGDEILELVRDGTLDGLSIGFAPIKDRWSDRRDMVERLEVALHEVSIVDYPAYSGASITGVRSDEHRISPEAAARRLDLLDTIWRP